MDPILENENQATTSASVTKFGKSKHKNKKKKNQNIDNHAESQTVVGERRKFVVTTLSKTDDKNGGSSGNKTQNNAYTIHFGTRGAESQRRDVRTIFKEKPVDTSRASSVERDGAKKEYETFHGTSTSPRTSLFDIFRIRRKSDSKKHQSLIQNVKAALGGTPKSTEEPEVSKDQKAENSKSSDKKYYHTVTGASSRKYSPITRVMDIFRSKPHSDANQSTVESSNKKKSSKQVRRSSIGTTSPTYHKNSYASLDPSQAKQLFREVRGLPKYDPYLSIVQISLGGRDKTRLLLNFFKYHKCHEILPKSAKVIIFDTQFLVRKTFPTLISHGIRSAPLWDSSKKQLVGMITVTDFIRILLHLDNENIPMEDLEKHTLHSWKRLLRPTRKPLCIIDPAQSLHEAINLLNKNRIHRLLMVDSISGDVLYILSHKRILRFLFVYLNEFPELTFFHKTLPDLKIGTYDDILSVTDETSIKEAFQLLLDKDVSALPTLDDSGKLLGVYAKYEVMNLVSEKLYTNLSLTIGEVRSKKKDWEEKLQKCRSSITLYEALEVIVRTESHRLLLVDRDDKLIGIVSLSDILIYLNRIIPPEKKVSSLQEIFRPLQENKVAESSKESELEITLEVPNLIKNVKSESESRNILMKLNEIDKEEGTEPGSVDIETHNLTSILNANEYKPIDDNIKDNEKATEANDTVNNIEEPIEVVEENIAKSNSKDVIVETSESMVIA